MSENWRDLYDYPMSWTFWRGLCVDHGEPDPGPDRPSEYEPERLAQRITALEENRTISPAWNKHQWDAVAQLKGELAFFEKKFQDHVTATFEAAKKKPKPSPKGFIPT